MQESHDMPKYLVVSTYETEQVKPCLWINGNKPQKVFKPDLSGGKLNF